VYSCEGDRQTDAPRGVFGGWDGLVASCRKNADRADEERLDAKVTGVPFEAGDFIELVEPNAAGYGDPLERDPELVREDVLDDFTSLELAREAYGVVFTDAETLAIDTEATEQLREELRASPDGSGSLTAYFAERRPERRPNPVSVAGDREFGKA
jgi:N-methylhydantoinase B/oxoprolinase/acetone carboxylase alpha subunit